MFIGVGFETTAPSTCVPLQRNECPDNFSVYSCHRLCPPAIEMIFGLGESRIDGFIMPGHVAVITGYDVFKSISKNHHVPQVISGFEPLDILMSCYMLCKQIDTGHAEVENEYTRLVKPNGNPIALKLMDNTFNRVDRLWRGFPIIPKSALALKSNFQQYDATKIYEDILSKAPDVESEATGCMCGDVLRGSIKSQQCPMFGNICKPASPMGPCMVS